MTDVERQRAQAAICSSFAASTDDPEIKRKLLAMADEYEAKAAHAKARSLDAHPI